MHLYVIGHCHISSVFWLAVVGGIFWDRPYGLNIAKWDEAIFSEMDDKDAFDQLNIFNRGTDTVMVTHQHIREVTKVMDACERAGYLDSHMFQTYKPAQNARVRNAFVNACDLLLIHYRGGLHASQRNFVNSNPVKRHNWLALPLLRSKTVIGAGEEPINPCEKHPLIAYHLSKRLFPPGMPVLVIGSGSGGEVIGLLRAGFNVVAVDCDAKQMVGLRARLVQEAANFEKNTEEMDSFYRAAWKDMVRFQIGFSRETTDKLFPDVPNPDAPDVIDVTEPADVKVEVKELVGECPICTYDLVGTPSSLCSVCSKVACHDNCFLVCPSSQHRGCSKACVLVCACPSPSSQP